MAACIRIQVSEQQAWADECAYTHTKHMRIGCLACLLAGCSLGVTGMLAGVPSWSVRGALYVV
jgi:hypothetical protein